jgi:hypothetical protein
MALISCPACDKQISQMASACPSCGHPAASAHPVERPAVQTVEQTSKGYKAGQLIGVLMLCASPIACSAGEHHASAWLMILGFVIYICARIGAWWNNG